MFALHARLSGHWRLLGTLAGAYLTESVYKVVSQTLISPQIRQRILYQYQNKGYVDRFVMGLTFTRNLSGMLPFGRQI